FDGYHFVGMDKTSDPANGKVTEGTKHVIYVYEKNPETKKGSVDVKYVTTDGKVLEATKSVKDNAPVGEEYTTEEKSFDGYHFVGMDKTSDPATGVVAEGTKHVIYVYEKNQEKGTVIVHFVDEDGNKISDDVVNKKDVPTGEDYTTTPKDIPGYELDKNKIPSNKDGVVVKGTTEVTYVYHKTPEPTPTPSEPEVPKKPSEPTKPEPKVPEEPKTPEPSEPSEPVKKVHKKHVVHKKHQSWNKNSGIHAEKQWNVNKGPHAENNRWTNNYVPQGESWSNDYKPYGENSTQSKVVNESSHKTLPQTGERHSIMTIMLGSLLAATGLMALFIDDKRKKN
uniref:MucBP domain-containing protein n=1 Tax=Lactobacillus gallinarum TaxID=52242 RepID=UPI0024BAEB13